MTQMVENDPQFGVTQITRPQPEVLDIYGTGTIPATRPIYLYPGGQPRDPAAVEGRDGYDPDLIRGTEVPFGAILLLWIPNVAYIKPLSDPQQTRGYKWTFQHRIRNLRDYLVDRTAYQMAQIRGPDDTTGPTPQPRVALPVCQQTIEFVGTEAVGTEVVDGLRQQVRSHGVDHIVTSEMVPPPLIEPGVEGVVQQGIYDPAAVPDANRAGFLKLPLKANGNELVIAVWRDDGPANWDFSPGGADEMLADKLGPSAGEPSGLYVHYGVGPAGPDVRLSDNGA